MSLLERERVNKTMAEVAANGQQERSPSDPLPELNNGDRLSRAEFERRYSAWPDIKKAELVEGVVYVPSPVRLDHAERHYVINALFGPYVLETPGVWGADNATLRLDLDNEVQPDLALWLPARGRVRETADNYLEGAPELIVEVALTSAAYDLHDKRRAYRRNGVQEYLVLLVAEQKSIWFHLEEDEYRPIHPNDEGVLCSHVFPGLWLHPEMFWNNDWQGARAVIQRGLASAEHAAFVAQLTTKDE